MKLLLVEDDPSISNPLKAGLHREGFEVVVAQTGQAALEAPQVDLVLLDLGLPDLDGRVVCQELRASSEVPIIVVTARQDEIDRVILLELGADDYVVKPFGFRELVARIRAVLRRTTKAAPNEPTRTQWGPLDLDRRSRRVEYDGVEIDLTPKEFEVLAVLAADPGAAVTREQLISDVWDANWWGSTKTLDVHIASIRKKTSGDLIETIRGVGFRLAGD